MATKQPKPPKPTVYAKNNKYGLASFFDTSRTQNFITDFNRNNNNFVSSIMSGILSRKEPKYGAGDYLQGTATPAKPARKNVDNTLPGTGSPTTFERTDRPVEPAYTPDPPAAPPAKTLADYLMQARSMGLGGGDGTNYDALSGQLRANGATGDAKLAAMYDALARSTAGDAAGIQANFDNTGSKMAASSAAATKDTAQAYNSTRDAQAAQFKALGIEGVAGTLAANGAQATRDQNIAQANIAQNSAANQNQNTAKAGNAQQYNTGVVQSNRSAGVEARSRLQQQLATKLAELESAKVSSRTNGAQQAFSAAMQLMQMDPANPSNQLSAQNAAQDRQMMLDGRMATMDNTSAKTQKTLAEITAMGSKQTLQQTLKGSTAQYKKIQQMVVAQGKDPNDPKVMKDFIDGLSKSGRLG